MTDSLVFYSVTSKDGEQNVTAVLPETGETLVADGTHPSFASIITLLATSGETVDADELRDLFDVQAALNTRFERISDRVSVRNSTVYFDGDPLYNELAEMIVKFYTEQTDFAPLVNFMEKIANNPQPNSRERLFAWLRRLSFAITPDGDFLAYKSVYRTDEPDKFLSVHSGTAIVDGEEITGQIPNVIGSVVEMPRNNVDDNTHAACSTGLHAGTYGYARTFSGNAMLAVKINPRDVVSVPSDSGDQKLRVCRYTVYGELNEEYDDVLVVKPDTSVQTEYGVDVDDDFDDDVLDYDDDEFTPAFENVPDKPVAPGAPRLENLTEEQVFEVADALGVSTEYGTKQAVINRIRNTVDYDSRRLVIEDALMRFTVVPDVEDEVDDDDAPSAVRLEDLNRDTVRKVARRLGVYVDGWTKDQLVTRIRKNKTDAEINNVVNSL